jgi:hypothetical protein
MIARIEPLSGIIRVWFRDSDGYGDPYQWVATVRWVDHESIEILGVISSPHNPAFSPSLFRAITAEAVRWGAARVGYKRIKQGSESVRWHVLA